MPIAILATQWLCWVTTCRLYLILLGISPAFSCTPCAQTLKHLLLPSHREFFPAIYPLHF